MVRILEKFKKLKFYELLTIVAFMLFIYNLLMLGYINLFQMKYHLGYDASAYYLKAYVMWQQHTFFPQFWSEQTTLYLDSAVPLAALLQNITNNILLSYGLANFIIDIGMILTLCYIIKDLKLNRLAGLIILNMFLCPYFTMYFNNANDVDWYSSLLTSGCWYGAKTFIILLVIKTILSLERGRKPYGLVIATMILSLITGVSSGYYVLVTVFLPAVVYLIIKVLMENDWKVLKCNTLYYVLINSVIIVIGKEISVRIIGFTSKDSNMVITGLKDFWKNIGSIFLGFVQLVGGMHMDSNVSALTIDGIVYIAGFGVVIICLIALVYYILQMIRKKEENGFLLIFSVLITNIAMFVVLYTTYGQPIFEVRYLCVLYIMIMLLVGYYFDSLEAELVWKKSIFVLLLVAVFIKSVVGYGYYNGTKIDLEKYNQIIAKVSEGEAPVVYVLGNDLGITGRNLRVLDTEHVYKNIDDNINCPHWGDYTYYDENGSWQGSTVIVTTAEKFELLPAYIKKLYTAYETLDNLIFYKSDINRFDYNTAIIKEMDYYIDYMTTPGYSFANGAIDMETGTYTSNGTGGYIMWGPYAYIEEGTYDITLNYEVLTGDVENVGVFDIAIDNGTYVMAGSNLGFDSKQVVLENVRFDRDVERVEYRCYLENGVSVRLDSIIIEGQEDEKN